MDTLTNPTLAVMRARIAELVEARDGLVEALQAIDQSYGQYAPNPRNELAMAMADKARAALAKVQS